jgi:signal transduction histidine kinase
MFDPTLSLFDIANQWNVRRLFANYRGALKTISYEIEDTVINGGVYTRIFAGFQKYSYFLPRLERYRELARTADGIWVFGLPDVHLPVIPGITYVPLTEQHRLVAEWFLVVDAPEYFSALTAQDLSGFDDLPSHRRFRGVWTFDDTLVNHLQVTLSKVLNLPPLTMVEELPRDYRYQLRQLAISTGHLVDMLESRNRELNQARQLREDLSHMLVHDMRNPLTGMIGNLNLLVSYGSQIPPEKHEHFIKRAIESGNTLKGMVDDLLDLAKLEEGFLEIKRKQVDVEAVIQNAIKLSPATLTLEDKKLHLHLSEDLPFVLGEADKLTRVVGNLLSNALKYAHQDIKLAAYVDGDQVVLSVQDDGPGIPPDAKEKIFEKFKQVGGREQRQGTGLGLTFCRLMVEAHGGRIWVESENGAGSTFFFTIPREGS